MSRTIEKQVRITATPEAVFRALTDAEEITRWFAPQAEATPGAGGRIFLSWGAPFEGESRIEIWEPNRHLRTCEVARPVALDYYLEGQGGETVLRLVHSGFGDDASWDDEFNNVTKGWNLFLSNLRHYLERYPGQPCRQATIMMPVPVPQEEAWNRLLGPEVLVREGSTESLGPGRSYAFRTATGEELRGTVDAWQPPSSFTASVDNLSARLCIELVTMQGATFMSAQLLAYGAGADAIAPPLQARWSEQFQKALSA
jgi:uncharacterized protein YndB with AHSA1/START domain